MPGDEAQNKAGRTAGTDRFGHVRMRSYGTMTADGIRRLLRCGLAEDHPRVAAARRGWSGTFPPHTIRAIFPPTAPCCRTPPITTGSGPFHGTLPRPAN